MIAWWLSRTLRERIMLGVLLALAAALLISVAVVAPLAAAGERAERRYERALATDAAVARDVAAIKALRAGAAPRTPDQPLDRIVGESATAAGVTLARVEADPAGGLRIFAPSVAPTALFPWLAALEREHGVAAEHLAVVKNDSGALEVDATLRTAR